MSEREKHAIDVARDEAAPFVVVAACLDIGLGLVSAKAGWTLFGARDWWIWLLLAIPAVVLAGVFLLGLGADGLSSTHRRRIAVGLLVVLMVTNVLAIGCVIGSLLSGSTMKAGQLLLSAFVVLLVNMITFGLAFWELDEGGPIARKLAGRSKPDFQFPQDENPQLAPEGWAPGLGDYVYLALTNSVAFSPTDAMPLTHRAKLLMGVESAVALVTVLIVAARAVNILGAG